jgi:hypothetical protein
LVETPESMKQKFTQLSTTLLPAHARELVPSFFKQREQPLNSIGDLRRTQAPRRPA